MGAARDDDGDRDDDDDDGDDDGDGSYSSYHRSQRLETLVDGQSW